MSRLDSIVAFIDSLDAKANKLLETAANTEYILKSIDSINNSITRLDSSIEEVRELMEENHKHLSYFSNLYEKAFYLESNLAVNDNITNHTSFETLTTEFKHLIGKLRVNDKHNYDGYGSMHFTPRDTSSVHTPIRSDGSVQTDNNSVRINTPLRQVITSSSETVAVSSQEALITPESSGQLLDRHTTNGSDRTVVNSDRHTPTPLKSQISISNLKLKPIRCNTAKVYKKKSHYRLSSIYNLNPIAYEDAYFSGMEDEQSTAPNTPRRIIPSASSKASSNIMDYNHDNDNILDYENHYEYDQQSVYNAHSGMDSPSPVRIPDGEQVEILCDANTESTSPLIALTNNRQRSNSLPETHSLKNQRYDLTTAFSPFHLNEDDPETLRLNRLKHFISFGNLHDLDNFPEQELLDDLYHSSPRNEVVPNIDDPIDLDNVSICSDLSYFDKELDPEEGLGGEVDNFENYLRKSRIDLHKAFPHLLQKSKSSESLLNSLSIYSDEVQPIKEENKPTFSYKFHNPIENVKLSTSSQSATATVEPIYFKNGPPKKKLLFAPEPEDPKQILSDVMLRTEQRIREVSPISSPLKITSPNFSTIFNFNLNASSFADERRNSIDLIGKSLSNGFKQLVNTPASIGNSPKPKRASTPQKIRDLKRLSREHKPITVQSETQAKRLPVRIPRNDGSFSQMTIGPNKTYSISHGDSSMFRKPVVSRVSHNSLREALAQSLLDL
ncbi:uncharacterized protein RJT20DRAFT_126959 [Scheffersomyces xylosifermentans]|uniref:uncharacterized protein n=1 Tax=Scheffersomyces xylosifermentans TaxID=1304137 RepID=UPI00315CC26B